MERNVLFNDDNAGSRRDNEIDVKVIVCVCIVGYYVYNCSLGIS